MQVLDLRGGVPAVDILYSQTSPWFRASLRSKTEN